MARACPRTSAHQATVIWLPGQLQMRIKVASLGGVHARTPVLLMLMTLLIAGQPSRDTTTGPLLLPNAP